MENILGLIVFIIFVALRTMSDRKKGMARGPKAKPMPQPPKSMSKPLIQSEPAGARKVRPVAEKPAATVPAKHKPAWLEPAMPPPLTTMKTALHSERKSDYSILPPREEIQPPQQQTEPVTEYVTAGTNGQIISYEELRRAVLWSEVLAKPRALRRNIR